MSRTPILGQSEKRRKNHATAEEQSSQMEEEGFGSCTNTGACEAECPKEISISNIARLNREYFSASISKG